MTSLSEEEKQSVKMKVAELQNAILNAVPQMPTILSDIHKQLKAYPECVTALDEEEIAIIVNGLQKFARIDLAAQTAKSAGSKATKEKLKNVSVDDL